MVLHFKSFLAGFVLSTLSIVNATAQIPTIGQPMPDFKLNEITHYTSTSASLSDFRGKWLALDFWFPGCSSCIRSFPKVNDYHLKFKDELVWMMVGLNQKPHSNSRTIYEKLRVKRNLQMPCAYDSLLSINWNIHAMPHIILVDPQGMVKHITSGGDLTEEALRAMIDGDSVTLNVKDRQRPEFEINDLINKGADIANDSANNVIYLSALTHHNGETQGGGLDFDDYVRHKLYKHYGGFRVAMVPLYALYHWAYLGKWNWNFKDSVLYGKHALKPVLELEDPAPFQYDYIKNVGKGTYNYNLTLPENSYTPERMMQCLQQDLHRAFGYEVVLEPRPVKVMKFVARPGAIEKIRTRGGEEYISPAPHAVGFTLRNCSPAHLVAELSFYFQVMEIPFVDESGMKGNIDFTLDADMTNLEDVRTQLRKQGFDLVEGTKTLNAIVIRDPAKFAN